MAKQNMDPFASVDFAVRWRCIGSLFFLLFCSLVAWRRVVVSFFLLSLLHGPRGPGFFVVVGLWKGCLFALEFCLDVTYTLSLLFYDFRRIMPQKGLSH